MANELVIRAMVDNNRETILKRLPSYLTPEHFFQLAYSLDKDQKLREVAQRNPESVMSAIFKAADCGLIIGGPHEHCWIIPYGPEAVFTVGWKGFVYQWLRAGAVLMVTGSVVYKGDQIEIVQGEEERIIHRPAIADPTREDPKWLGDPKNILGAYAIATLPAGLKQRRWCPKGEIEQSRLRSPNASGPAWTHSYAAMARKTPIRRLNGVIQVCGPTPENREAWERYGRTIELDRRDFKTADDLDDDLTAFSGGDDDLPGDKDDQKIITIGRGKKKSPAPPPPLLTPAKPPAPPSPSAAAKPAAAPPPPPPPPPTADDPLIDEQVEYELMELGQTLGMKATEILALVKQQFGIASLRTMHKSQAFELGRALQTEAERRLRESGA